MTKTLNEQDFRTLNLILQTQQYVPLTMGSFLTLLEPITQAMDTISVSRPELKRSMTALHDRLLDYYQTSYLVADIFRGKLNLGTVKSPIIMKVSVNPNTSEATFTLEPEQKIKD